MEIQTDPQITTNKRTTFGTCDVMWHHCIVFLKNCSDVNLDIHFISSFGRSCVDRGIAAKTAALSRSGKRKPLSRAHGLRHRARISHCMPDASLFHHIAFAWPSAPHNYHNNLHHTWIWHWRGRKERKKGQKTSSTRYLFPIPYS